MTPEDVCGRCGGPNLTTWHAPSPLWNAVMRRSEREPFDGIVCPRCFGELAREAGVADRFCLTTHDPKVDLPSVFGDGRVWDAGKCMWVEGNASAPPPIIIDARTTPEERHERGGYDETLLFACCPGLGAHHHDCSICDAYAATFTDPAVLA